MNQTIANIGAFFFGKARANQREAGTYQAARNLRKQGVPLSIALEVLARRPLRYGADTLDFLGDRIGA
jgi:hypothetical protein